MKTFDLNKELTKIKQTVDKDELGMILVHNGVVRGTSRVKGDSVSFMELSYDREKLALAIDKTKTARGVKSVVVWINEGKLAVGDDIMYVIVAGDRRSNILKPFEGLIEYIKGYVVIENEQITL